jgi:hypothetical protein
MLFIFIICNISKTPIADYDLEKFGRGSMIVCIASVNCYYTVVKLSCFLVVLHGHVWLRGTRFEARKCI